MRVPQEYYIASGLENVAAVRELKAVLDADGWGHTYDWTVHGSVQSDGDARLREVAAEEACGVAMAHVVIVLLPGGRGTHVELGMALARPRCCTQPRVVIYASDPETFSGTNGSTCAFYFHPLVERFTDMNKMINSLLGAQ